MRPTNERGFSLLLGMMIVIVLAIIGTTAMRFSMSETGTSGARVMRRQALAAAESGLHQFMGLTQPATPDANGYYIGNNSATSTDAWQWLPPVKGPRGETLEPRYQVFKVNPQPASLPPDSTLVQITGQVVTGGKVAGTAWLHALVEAKPGGGGGPTEQGQKSTGPLGGSSTIPIVSNISLITFTSTTTP